MIVIVGAGPAGLTMGRYLQQHKLPFLLVEKGRVGESWHNHYDSLRLHTLKQVSHLPGLPFPPDTPTFPSREDVANHLVAYAKHFDLPVQENTAVLSVEHHNQWHIETSSGKVEADILVAATGIWSYPFIPTFDGQDSFSGQILHVNQYRNPDTVPESRVLIVGLGNSSADIAVELAEAGRMVGLSLRHGVPFVPYPASIRSVKAAAWLFRTIPPTVSNWLIGRSRADFSDIGLPPSPQEPRLAYPIVGFQLPDAVRAGNVAIHPEIARLDGNRVHFTDGSDEMYDAIILATGYRPALQPLAGAIETDDKGRPLVNSRGRSLLNPTAYALGYDYPATSGWIQNMRRVAQIMAADIAKAYRVR